MNKYHFIGIGGIGMSALARILLEKKSLVSGSDLTENANTQALMEKGAVIQKGHSAKHISYQDTVVYSSDIKKTNPEYQAALALKCKMLHRSELLASLMSENKTLAVAGTHGKTTTTALLTHILLETGLDPTFAIGGIFKNRNGGFGKGPYFVAEADESDGSFLNYLPFGAILTNIEPEHMNHFKTEEALHNAFLTFMEQIQERSAFFYCGDDPVLRRLAKGKGISYGFGEQADVKIIGFEQRGWEISYQIHWNDKVYENIQLPLVGRHNALNSAAAFALALRIGVEEQAIKNALKLFPGVGRRCQKRKEIKSVLFLDDYAHHPTEIIKTLEGVKNAVKERRLIALFQPHRYSRTADHLNKYNSSFENADMVLVTDIYSAGEEPIEGVTTAAVLEGIKASSNVPCEYLPRDKIKERLEKLLRPHDVLITLGAGDITHIHKEDFSINKFTLGLIFGGQSCEHEISLKSCRYIYQSLNQELYDLCFFGIDKKGRWLAGNEAKELLLTQETVNSNNCGSLLESHTIKELETCDIFLPILHGTYGEDGTLQGLFEIIGKPYIGPDSRSAAICMDKILTKRLVEKAGVMTPKDLSFNKINWQNEKESLLKEVERSLTFPVYVKPVHLGSSVGISKVMNKEELCPAIEKAFCHDMTVMVEEGKEDCRELEFAVIGNTIGYEIKVPPPGEKLAGGHFVDYNKKYGKNPVQTTVSPGLENKLLAKGREAAKTAYLAVGSSGMTRVDFLLDKEGNFWFFDMNPIPGMQQHSLFPKIWKREGLAADHLLNELIILGLHRKRLQDRYFSLYEPVV